jgi:hypothetical protein
MLYEKGGQTAGRKVWFVQKIAWSIQLLRLPTSMSEKNVADIIYNHDMGILPEKSSTCLGSTIETLIFS